MHHNVHDVMPPMLFCGQENGAPQLVLVTFGPAGKHLTARLHVMGGVRVQAVADKENTVITLLAVNYRDAAEADAHAKGMAGLTKSEEREMFALGNSVVRMIAECGSVATI